MFKWREILSPGGGRTGCWRWYHGYAPLCDHEHDEFDTICEDARDEMARVRSFVG